MTNPCRYSGRLLRNMKGSWLAFVTGGLMSVVSESGIQLSLALLLRGLVNGSVSSNAWLLLSSVGRYGALITVMACLLPLAHRLWTQAAEMMVKRWREALFDHLLNLPTRFFDQHHSQDIISRLTNDAEVAKQFFGEELIAFLSQVVSAVLSAVFIVFIDSRFVVIPLVVVAASLFINRITAASLHRLSRFSQDSLAEVNASLKEMVNGQTVARALCFNNVLEQRFCNRNDEYRARNVGLVGLQSFVGAVNNFFGALNFFGVAALGSFMMLQRELTPGEVVAAVQLSQVMVKPFKTAGSFFSALHQTSAASERIFEVLDRAPERLPHRRPAATEEVAVSFADVSFSYGEVAALCRVSFRVPHGATVAFVGESGGGKSTIFKLLLGLYPAEGGSITVNGRDIGDYSLEELRGVMALVPQDVLLFSGTIYDNISCGRDDVDEEMVIAAAKAAHAHDFISSFALGYQAEVGERGVQLSGGQRQRIAIARAWLKDAPIILLDEATSNLDNESEKLVWDALHCLMQDRTTLLIAHRLSTARKADLICVLAGGKIVEQGTHDELVTLGGYYKRLYVASGEDKSVYKDGLPA